MVLTGRSDIMETVWLTFLRYLSLITPAWWAVVCELVLSKVFWVTGNLVLLENRAIDMYGCCMLSFNFPRCLFAFIALGNVDSSGVTWQLPGTHVSPNWKNLGRLKLFWKEESYWKQCYRKWVEYIELELWKGFLKLASLWKEDHSKCKTCRYWTGLKELCLH